MLKRYKNAFFEEIQRAGLDVGSFSAEETITDNLPAFQIRFKAADLTFTTRNSARDSHLFDFTYTRYTPGFLQPPDRYHPEEGYTDFRVVLKNFTDRLAQQVRTAIDDELLPDLWATASQTLGTGPSSPQANFTDEERRQLKIGLSTFRLLLIEHYQPTQEQLNVISQHLNYLEAAVDRLNRFDWKAVAVSTLMSISITLSLDTDRGRQLYGLFQQALSALLHLLK